MPLTTPDASQLQTGLAALPLRREADISSANGIGMFQILTVVLLIVLFISVVLWRRRRSGLGTSGSWRQWMKASGNPAALQVLQSTQLTPATSVHVLHWDGQEWLVGCNQQSIAVLGKRVVPEDTQSHDKDCA